MSWVKVIEIMAQSEKSWEDAAQDAIKQAAKTLRNIKSLYIKDMLYETDGKAPRYRLTGKLSFTVDDVK